MKVTWEARDIKVGRLFSKEGIGEILMIGYDADVQRRKLVMISHSDGMVIGDFNETTYAEMLNANGYLPIELLQK